MRVWNPDSSHYSSSIFPEWVSVGFATKKAGDGREHHALKHLLHKEKIPYKHIIHPSQYHSNVIKVVRSESVHEDFRCDGLITQENGIVLSVITADCSPIIFVDVKKHIVGISHQGWKGTLGLLPSLMIEEMVHIGSKVEDIFCALGPCINDCCYQIYGERYQAFKKQFGSEVIRETDENKYVNINKCNYITLLKSGISAEHIDYFPFCTSCNEDEFWSYHRDGEIKGEMVSFVSSNHTNNLN